MLLYLGGELMTGSVGVLVLMDYLYVRITMTDVFFALKECPGEKGKPRKWTPAWRRAATRGSSSQGTP